MPQLAILPTFESTKKTRQARLLTIMLLFVLGGTIINLGFSLALYAGYWQLAWLDVLTIFIEIGLLWGTRRGYLQITGILFCASTWGIITYIVWQGGGVLHPYFNTYLMVVVVSGFLFNGYVAYGFAALSILVGLLGTDASAVWAWPADGVMVISTLMLLILAGLITVMKNLLEANFNIIKEQNTRLQQEIKERQSIEDALRESEERYRQLMNDLPVGVVVNTFEGEREILYMNPSAEALFERTIMQKPEKMSGLSWLVDEDRAIAYSALECLQNGHTVRGIEFRVNSPDATPLYLEGSATAIHYQHHKAIMSILQDVTDRKQMELELAASEQRYSHLMNTLPIGLIVMALEGEGEMLYINPAGEKILQSMDFYPPYIEGNFEWLHPDDREDYMTRIQTLLDTREPVYGETRVITPTGEIHYLDSVATYTQYQQRPAMMSIVTDVTARKHAEQLAKEREENYQQLLQISPNPTIITDLESQNILYANRATARLLGVENPDRLLGEQFLNWLPEQTRRSMDAAMIVNDEGQQVIHAEMRIRRQDGLPVDVEYNGVAINYQGHTAMLTIMTDITERKRHEESERLRHEIEQEQKISKLRDNFIAITSHEFRTPLTVIVSSKEILMNYSERLTPERRMRHYQNIDQSVNTMIRLLDDIQILSRAGAGLLEFYTEPHNPVELVRSLVDKYKEKNPSDTPIQFYSQDDWPGKYMLDVELIHQVVTKLLINAQRYAPTGSEIEVTVRQSDNQTIIISVRDMGDPIREEDRKNLFNAFYRIKEAKDLRNSGLELAIVQQCAATHGGNVDVFSAEGLGTTFIVELPMVIAPPDATRFQ